MDDLPMVARQQIRLACLAALTGPAFAGVDVQSPGDWTTPTSNLPVILLKAAEDRKESVTRGQPEFTTTVTVDIAIRAGARNASAAQDAIDLLCYAVETALLKNNALISIVNQVSSVDTKVEFSSEGKEHIAGAKMSFAFEVPEMFEPVIDQPLLEFGLHIDTAQPFDANGNYANPLFPVSPAPRTSGPDGRDEGRLEFQLPQ